MRLFIFASITPGFPICAETGAHESPHELHLVLGVFSLNCLLPHFAFGHLEFCIMVLVVLDLFVVWLSLVALIPLALALAICISGSVILFGFILFFVEG